MTSPIENKKRERALESKYSGRKHLLDLDDFEADEIELFLDTTDEMSSVLHRQIKKVPTLRGKVIILAFYESSTRTRVSFEEAAKILSAEVITIQESHSSLEKGESLLNTSLTLQAMGADIIVLRHRNSGAPYLMTHHLNYPTIINGGDGWHAHPTQALVDLYTIRSRLKTLNDIKVVIVGDILHSRVARSNIWGLATMGARIVICGPPTLMPLDILANDPRKPQSPNAPFDRVEFTTDLDKALQDADVVMALRLQAERHQTEFLPPLREYVRLWQVNEKRLSKAKPHVLVMHPGPINEGIEISPSLAHSALSSIEQQVTNGVAVRMAVLYLLTTNRSQ